MTQSRNRIYYLNFDTGRNTPGNLVPLWCQNIVQCSLTSNLILAWHETPVFLRMFLPLDHSSVYPKLLAKRVSTRVKHIRKQRPKVGPFSCFHKLLLPLYYVKNRDHLFYPILSITASQELVRLYKTIRLNEFDSYKSEGLHVLILWIVYHFCLKRPLWDSLQID